MMCRSVRHTPAPPTLTITSRGPVIVGSGTSSTVGVSWNLWIRTAFTWSSRSIEPRERIRRGLGLDSPAIWVAGLEHARADGRVGLDAGLGDAGLAQVQRDAGLGDAVARLRVEHQRRVVAGGQAEVGPALA